MEFEDQEDHDEEMEMEMEMEPSYDSLVNNNNGGTARVKTAAEAAASAVAQLQQQQQQLQQLTRKACRYKECLKNHAVGIGGHALDGCCEFLAAGAEGTLDALKCAACNCHRNFHRKETDEPYGQLVPQQGHNHHHHHHGFGHPQFSASGGYYRTPAGYLHVTTTQHRPLALPSTSGGGGTDQDDDMSNPGGGGGSGGAIGFGMGTMSSKKRFRTKFSQEQKERMLELAERLGWRIQKQDEAVVQSFCDETGVKRHILKVWMHNNKHTLGKKP